MSRLDSFIRRMQAQRTCLDWAIGATKHLDGPVLELGLGNGRTYDHLRENLAGRDIYVFDRRIKAHPDCIPPDDHTFLGEVLDTLPQAHKHFGRTISLIHTDLGTGVESENAELARAIAPHLDALLAPDGICVANHELGPARWTKLPEPPGVKPGRYFLYRAA